MMSWSNSKAVKDRCQRLHTIGPTRHKRGFPKMRRISRWYSSEDDQRLYTMWLWGKDHIWLVKGKIYRIPQYNMLGQKLRLSTSPMKRRKTYTEHWYVNFATSTDHQRVSVRDVRDVSPDTVHPPLCQSSRSSWKTTMFSCYIIIYIYIYIYVGKRKSS
jgi:hypothetical protein